MDDPLFDRLGHIICDQCARPMKMEMAKELPGAWGIKFVCDGCDVARVVELPRPSTRTGESAQQGRRGRRG